MSVCMYTMIVCMYACMYTNEDDISYLLLLVKIIIV